MSCASRHCSRLCVFALDYCVFRCPTPRRPVLTRPKTKEPNNTHTHWPVRQYRTAFNFVSQQSGTAVQRYKIPTKHSAPYRVHVTSCTSNVLPWCDSHRTARRWKRYVQSCGARSSSSEVVLWILERKGTNVAGTHKGQSGGALRS